MAFQVSDFHDLVVLLEQHPQWRAELRRLVLTDEILTLPQAVRDLATSVRELTEAQKRTEARLDRLDNRIGVSVEEEAAGVLRVVLEKKGFTLLGSEFNLRMDGDVDVVLPLRDAQGQPVWAVLEAKVRLSGRAVEAWSNRMRSPGFQDALHKAGVGGPYLVYSYGMRIDLSAREAAEKLGIGLLGSQGEQVAPGTIFH